MIHGGAPTPAFRQRFARFLRTCVALFVALGYLAALSHMAFVAHAACAEHGQLVHLQEGHGLSVASRDLQRAPSRDAAASADASDSALSDEHDHCVNGLAQASDTPVHAAQASLVPHDPAAVIAPLARSSRSPAVPRLRGPIAILFLSPKSSPPG